MKRLIYDLCLKIVEGIKHLSKQTNAEGLERDNQYFSLLSEIRKMAETLEEAVARNVQKVGDAVTAAVAKEAGEVKQLIKDGNTAAAIASLDQLGDTVAAAVTTAVDSISVTAQEPDAENPPTG